MGYEPERREEGGTGREREGGTGEKGRGEGEGEGTVSNVFMVSVSGS